MTFLLLALACTSSEAPPIPALPVESGDSAVDSPDLTGDTAGTHEAPLPGVRITSFAEGGLHTPSAAVDEDGRLYVTWGERGIDGYTRAWLSVSVDAGGSWSAPLQVSAEGQDVVARWPEGPVVAVGGGQVYLAYGAYELGTAPYAFYVQSAPVDTLTFERATKIPLPGAYHTMNFPTLGVHPDGGAWFAFVVSPVYTGRLWVAREEVGWAIEDVTASSPLNEVPCECCPPAFGFYEDGRVLVGWRGDIQKELYTAVATPGQPFAGHTAITNTGVEGYLCPQDGMQFLEHEGSMWVAWSDTNPGRPRAFLSREASEGWSAVALAPGADEPAQARVSAAIGRSGLRMTWDTGWGSAARMVDGSEGVSHPIIGPSGPLSEVRPVTLAGRAVAVGLDDAGDLWLVHLEPE